MGKTLLAVDIGNTNVNMGLFRGLKLSRKSKIPLTDPGWQNMFLREVKRAFSNNRPSSIIISSVVPQKEKYITGALAKIFKVRPLLLGRDLKVPIKNLYKRPAQVGQDRLVSAYAAAKLYKAPLIIIDFGTAVTFDVVSAKGEYLGGIIFPGMEMSLEALSQRAALLPKVKLERPSGVLGKSTAECMLSGTFYGYASMCDGIVRRIEKRFGRKFTVIATGGNAGQVARLTASIGRVDHDLTLKGISLISRCLARSLLGKRRKK